MACHSSVLLINVESAEGQTVEQATDAFITGVGGFGGQPNSLTIAGEEAVMLEPVYGQATSRMVFIVHANRLYTLNFIGPWGEDGNPELEQSERFYEQVIGSFEFLPTPPWTVPASQQLSVPAHVQGIKFIAGTTGMYKFKIISGSYSICPVGGISSDCGKWHSEIFAYVNRDIAWIAQVDGSFEPADPDFRLGSWLYFDTIEQAEAAVGGFYPIALRKGDFVWLLTPDERDAYDDNVGGMTVRISIMAPFP